MADAEIVGLRAKLASRPRSDDYRQRRREIDARGLQYGLGPDVKVEPVTANGVRAEWTSTPQDNSDAALLYLHGGGYVIGSLDSHRHLVAEAGRAAGCWALALDYRLAPENPFPAAVEDAVAGYRYLLARGLKSGRIAIAGDSAGGGLVVAAMLAIRDAGFRAVIAPSFGDIFRANAFKTGILAVELPESQVRHLIDLASEDPTARLEIDVRAQKVRGEGFEYRFELDPFIKHCLVDGLDEIGLVERHGAAISGYETQRPEWLPAIR